jgi:hypothetical protein
MRADTQTISIDAPPSRLIDFLADPNNLPRWAVGFAQSIRHDNDRWVVQTGAGEMAVRIDAHPGTGIVDFWMSPAPDAEMAARSRVVPRGSHSEYIFTQFQAPGMNDAIFARNVAALKHELTVLKALMEVDCPS